MTETFDILRTIEARTANKVFAIAGVLSSAATFVAERL